MSPPIFLTASTISVQRRAGTSPAPYHIQRAVGGIKYVGFRDPDGNTWTLPKITPCPSRG
ncbi:hypothetical protein [Hymenobacter frigidus]|uniref:hypothetical protein n=1 Tax=Hymenobacter frigidus TaxID=1524095 RepID=UPI00166CAB6A|nr:hypothetical protein [Hymenobacter frigidus]